MAAFLWNGIRVYADQADLTEWLGSDQSAVPDSRLASASLAVDNVIRGARYYTDGSDGFPTDAGIILALQLATCAVAAWRADVGDPTGNGAPGMFQEVDLGSAKYIRAPGGAGAPSGRTLPDDALAILRSVGLLSANVVVYG